MISTCVTDERVQNAGPPASERIFRLFSRAAGAPGVQAAVEENHDENRWWPSTVADWRVRMVVAGWSTRVSYSMVHHYAGVVRDANRYGYDRLTALDDHQVRRLVAPLGLATARLRYLRSLRGFLRELEDAGQSPLCMDADRFIARFAADVDQAGFKVAQCATLYARGYHTGVIPVDSGMVSKLTPLMGIEVGRGPRAHEVTRSMLESAVAADPDRFRRVADDLCYRVTIPSDARPTWLVHLVLIYFKRLYCNGSGSRLCPRRPACSHVFDCRCPVPG